MNDVKFISSKEEYLDLFKSDANKKVIKALDVALDTRKFEIELYWKRATYFWAFIAAAFTGFFVLINSTRINEYRGITILMAVIGLLFSIGWHFVNRGSKLWQENWERHVSYLEDQLMGPLFKTVKYPDYKLSNLLDGYTFSVSRVNQFLSILMVVIWIILFIYSIFFAFDRLIYVNEMVNSEGKFWIIFSSILVFVSFIIYLFYRCSLSFLKETNLDDIKKDSENKKLFLSSIDKE